VEEVEPVEPVVEAVEEVEVLENVVTPENNAPVIESIHELLTIKMSPSLKSIVQKLIKDHKQVEL
jgi:hypothetical protein